MSEFYRNPGYWRYALAPLLIMLALYGAAGWFFWVRIMAPASAWVNSINGPWEWVEVLLGPLRWIIWLGILLLFLAALAMAVNTLYELFGALFFSRLTVLEGELYLSFCFENQHSERPGIARWRGSGVDFDAVCIGVPQQRNMILCPEKVKGLYMRLERPSNQWHDPFHIWYSFSPDLRYWGDSELLLDCEDVPFATTKIGGGAPPVRTDRGWLHIFHAVDDDPGRAVTFPDGRKWSKRYTAGAALFDPADPTELIAVTRSPLPVAEAPYETGGLTRLWTEFTVFPCGAVLEDDNLTLRIYYGAGDYCTNLTETTLPELWEAMTPCRRLAERATIPFKISDWKHYPRI